MQHLDEGTIHTWLDGELSVAEAAQAQRHVAECAECAAAVAEARGMIAGATRIVSALDAGQGAVAALPRQSAKAVAARSAWRSLRLTPTRAALAASLLIAAGALLTIRHDTPDKMLSVPMAMPASSPQVAWSPSPATSMGPVADSGAKSAPVSTRATPRVEAPRKVAEAKRADSVSQRQASAANNLASTSAFAPKVAAAPPAMAGVAGSQPPPVAAPPAAGAGDARPEVQRALVDSVAMKARAPGAGATAPERRAQSVMQLQEIVTTGATSARGFDVAGCYQIKSDTAAIWRLLPDRFALERGTGAVASNVVRAVRPDGRMDTVVTGSNWVQLSNDKARIQLAVGTKQQIVNLQLTSLGGVFGQATTTGVTRPIDIVRAVCHP